MGSIDALIGLQDLDTAADRLRHQRRALPQLAALESARAERAAAGLLAEEQRDRLHELRRQQKALEDEAATVEAKATQIDHKLYDGSVVAHKELEAFQADHRLLKARQIELEDKAIEVMEEAEPVEQALAQLDEELGVHDRRIEVLSGELEVAQSQLDGELDTLVGQRSEMLSEVPVEVLEAYESIRGRLGGTGAARLIGNRCDGCHLEIPSAELEQLRHAPPDALITCPECDRILVR